MEASNLFLPILLGTSRKERQSGHVAKWLHGRVGDRGGVETQLFDVRDFQLPQDNYGQEIKDDFPEWRDAVIRADGLIIVTP